MSAYTQFGYPYVTAASQLLMPGQPSTASTAGTSCCETGRPVATDPVTGQAICSCQYDSSRLAALNSYPRLSTGSTLHYGTSYPSSDQNPYPSIGVDSSYFTTFGTPYGLKESGGADMAVYGGLGSTAGYGYSPYDPSLYGYGAPYDLAARRKNATRESTGTLKAWLNEHKKNPYPTKGEKIMLAIITKMTLTQVSTWFANARRRLKKENKMTWEPKNKTESDEEADDNAAAKDKTDKDETDGEKDSAISNDASDGLSPLARAEVKSETLSPGADWKDKPLDECGDSQKPKIWSLADTAVCKTPPPAVTWSADRLPAHTAATTFPLPPTIAPGGAPFGRYSHQSQSQSQSQSQPQSQSQSQSSPAAGSASGYHHSSAGGGAAYSSVATGSGGGGGGGYGGMAAPPPPSLSAAGGAYGDAPTDTPPQTPPSAKLGQLSALSKLAQLNGGGLNFGGSQYSSSLGSGRLSTLERRPDVYQTQLSGQQQHHHHLQQQQHVQQAQQTVRQQMSVEMSPYAAAAAYKDGSSGSIPPAEYVSPV